MVGRMAEALDRSNCGIARSRGKEAAVKPVSRRTEMPFKADGAGKPAGQRQSTATSFGTVRNRRTRTRMSGGAGAGGSNPPGDPIRRFVPASHLRCVHLMRRSAGQRLFV